MKEKRSHVLVVVLINIIEIVVTVQLLLSIWPGAGIYVLAGGVAYMMIYSVLLLQRRTLMATSSSLLVAIMVATTLDIGPDFLRTVLIYGVMLSLGLGYHILLRPKAGLIHNNVPFNKLWIPVVLITGVFFGEVTAGLVPLGAYWKGEISLMLLAFAPILAIVEEIVFRGLIQDGAHDSVHPVYAVIFSGLLYGAMFFPWGVMGMILATIVGMTNAFIYAEEKSLVFPVILNTVWKLSFLIFAQYYR